MKKTLLALFLLSATAALAQEEAEAGQPDATNNLTFDTDIYIAEPKFTLSFGVRSLGGSKSTFQGTGHLLSSQDIGPMIGIGTPRIYHDGTVNLDARGGVVDNGDGTTTFVPISPDGRTNTWSFINDAQALTGNIALHTYRADIVDPGPRGKNPGSTFGVEVAASRDMGKISTHIDWKLGAGINLSDLSAKLTSKERATITTLTDTFSLNGQLVPPAGKQPSSTTDNVTNADGFTTTTTTDTTALLNHNPDNREISIVTSDTSVTNHFRLKGAFFTLRAGPTIILPLTDRLRASFSAGAALVYAGSTFSVVQDFQPETGAVITDTEQTTRRFLLPGYYADANVEFWLTERTGVYFGALYQNTGNFKQSINSGTASYATRVDLGSLQGFRMGMNIRF
ncbi:MAG: hypothetical protein EXS39_07620 [Opitutaceae bacterium]|nr:hypothetical protein [Opitutaceae bacterium]